MGHACTYCSWADFPHGPFLYHFSPARLLLRQKKKTSSCVLKVFVFYWSGRRDSNSRHPAPKAGALPDCATPRQISQDSLWLRCCEDFKFLRIGIRGDLEIFLRLVRGNPEKSDKCCRWWSGFTAFWDSLWPELRLSVNRQLRRRDCLTTQKEPCWQATYPSSIPSMVSPQLMHLFSLMEGRVEAKPERLMSRMPQPGQEVCCMSRPGMLPM